MGLLLTIITVFLLTGTVVQVSSFSFYSKTYNRLVSGEVVFDYTYGGLYYFCEPNGIGRHSSDIVFFIKSDGSLSDVKIAPSDYIHGGFLSYISPYSLYWWFKYKDWFEKNKEKFDNSK